MLVEDARGDNMEEAYSRAGHNCLIGSDECLLLFTPSCCSECPGGTMLLTTLGQRSSGSCPSGTQLSPQDSYLGYPPCPES